MSKLLENKQMVHIASEVVVIMGITFYFSRQNKQLREHIEDLAQRLEEQEDHIQKLEQTLTKLGSMVQTQIVPAVQRLSYSQPVTQTHPVRRTQTRSVKTARKKQNRPVKQVHIEEVQEDNEEEQVEEQVEEQSDNESDGDSDENSDLDDDIRDELKELEEESQTDLKKQTV